MLCLVIVLCEWPYSFSEPVAQITGGVTMGDGAKLNRDETAALVKL